MYVVYTAASSTCCSFSTLSMTKMEQTAELVDMHHYPMSLIQLDGEYKYRYTAVHHTAFRVVLNMQDRQSPWHTRSDGKPCVEWVAPSLSGVSL